jgi:hypothetical protein
MSLLQAEYLWQKEYRATTQDTFASQFRVASFIVPVPRAPYTRTLAMIQPIIEWQQPHRIVASH